jgi:hypothetical protein
MPSSPSSSPAIVERHPAGCVCEAARCRVGDSPGCVCVCCRGCTHTHFRNFRISRQPRKRCVQQGELQQQHTAAGGEEGSGGRPVLAVPSTGCTTRRVRAKRLHNFSQSKKKNLQASLPCGLCARCLRVPAVHLCCSSSNTRHRTFAAYESQHSRQNAFPLHRPTVNTVQQEIQQQQQQQHSSRASRGPWPQAVLCCAFNWFCTAR